MQPYATAILLSKEPSSWSFAGICQPLQSQVLSKEELAERRRLRNLASESAEEMPSLDELGLSMQGMSNQSF